MSEENLKEIKQLIDSMQSGLVELFDQLRDLRARLNLVSEFPIETSPSILPLFSEVKPQNSEPLDLHSTPPTTEAKSDTPDIKNETQSETAIPDDPDSGNSAKVNRVLDPIAHELRTGEAPAEIIYEYLQAAREYLVEEEAEPQKEKVARDMDIVLNFLKARGKRTIRPDERDNILKRIRRWKAHLAG